MSELGFLSVETVIFSLPSAPETVPLTLLMDAIAVHGTDRVENLQLVPEAPSPSLSWVSSFYLLSSDTQTPPDDGSPPGAFTSPLSISGCFPHRNT